MAHARAEFAQRYKALTHPLRVRIMSAIEPGLVVSPSRLAEQLGEPLEQVGYHVRRLVEWGCLEFVEDREVGGTIEHFYRVGERPFYDAEAWQELTPGERDVVRRGVLTDMMADIASADAVGALTARPEVHLSRIPLELDDRGWGELDELLLTLLEGAHEAAAQAAARVAAGETATDEVASARLLLIAIPAAPAPTPGRHLSEASRLHLEKAGTFRGPVTKSDVAQRYKALTHPLRAAIVCALVAGRVASPRELATELGEPLSGVSYHMRQLAALGCVELVDKRRRRGAIEHFYGFTQHPWYDDEAWARLTPDERTTVARAVVTAMLADIVGADAAGALAAQPDAHGSRSPLELDDRGWVEVEALMTSTLWGAHELAGQSAARVASGESTSDELSPARLMMLLIPAVPRPE